VDSKARCVGDLLTVVVAQETDVTTRETRGLGKSSSVNEAFSLEGKAGGGFQDQASNAGLDLSNSANRKFDGSASFRSNQEFTDRMTVTVMDVLPNGNLIVSGRRQVTVAGDDQTLVLTGVIRAIDIGPDNTVSSRAISELRLLYESTGTNQRFTRQGWMGRAANKLWPF
jgi:flagellar L-ring protein precursor FlgH